MDIYILFNTLCMINLAVFDFDGTITRKDSFLGFIRFSHGTALFTGGFAIMSPYLLLWKLGILKNGNVKQRVFGWFFKGMDYGRFQELADRFKHRISRMERPDIMEKLKEHVLQGDQIIIISASVENWIRPWAKQQQIEMVAGTEIEVKNGVLTGRFSSDNCYGIEKVNRLIRLFPDLSSQRNNYHITAYGDSNGDKELLAYANKGHYVG
ncbi:HAD hydrolase, family IB [Bacteroidales bacterium Barb4]|nr:HAD hydrolase, family IB [Bacteroidales bacterium Barb4]